jgi:hypothetical protein
MDPTEIIAAIRNALNLDDLFAAIQSAQTAIREDGDNLAGRHALERVMAELPTFGGTTPDDTSDVWSWDATRLLVGEGDLEIAIREEIDPDDDTIKALRTEAGETGDLEMVRICESALDGDQEALLECVYVIESARAMCDDAIEVA